MDWVCWMRRLAIQALPSRPWVGGWNKCENQKCKEGEGGFRATRSRIQKVFGEGTGQSGGQGDEKTCRTRTGGMGWSWKPGRVGRVWWTGEGPLTTGTSNEGQEHNSYQGISVTSLSFLPTPGSWLGKRSALIVARLSLVSVPDPP